MVIVQHFPGSVKQYAKASPRRKFAVPRCCPTCWAIGCLIRWGTYPRWARTDDGDYRIRVQRVRCKACGRTHSLLPDFVHPHRRYVIRSLQDVVSRYLVAGLGWGRLMRQMPDSGPVPGRTTVREWVSSFAYGAGELLLESLSRHLLALDPLIDLPDATPPRHLDRVPDPAKRRRLKRAHRFWLLAEQLYALVKTRQPQLHFAADQLFSFLLHWLQARGLPPRIFWNPALSTTPSMAF